MAKSRSLRIESLERRHLLASVPIGTLDRDAVIAAYASHFKPFIDVPVQWDGNTAIFFWVLLGRPQWSVMSRIGEAATIPLVTAVGYSIPTRIEWVLDLLLLVGQTGRYDGVQVNR